MFNSLVEKRDSRSRRMFLLLLGAFLLHAVVLVVVLVLDFLRVSPVPQPAVTITLLDAASLAPPPPPPPPPKKPKPKPTVVTKKTEQPKEMLAPKDIPKDEPKQEPAPSEDDGGEDGGVEGGVEGGVAGGVPAVAPPPPPPPKPTPAKPVFQATEQASKRRIAGREPVYPHRARLQGWEATLLVRVFISETGTVERLVFVQTDERFEDAVKEAVEGWRFTPHVVDGKPVKTYTVLKFVFKLS